MINCPEYAHVSSECPGSSWHEQTSFMDGNVVAPGAIPKSENVAECECENEIDAHSASPYDDTFWKPWNSKELRTATPGSIDGNTQIALGLREAIEQEFEGHVCKALDIVYSRISELIQLGWISQLNDEIASIDPNEFGTDVLLGILTATLPVRSKLQCRGKLYRDSFKILKRRRHFERGILDGLE